MATINKIEIQDSNGNIYYPHTESDIVKHGNGTLKDAVDNKLPLTGGNVTGNVNFANDNTGLGFFGGAKVFKKAGTGLRIVPHSDVTGVVISNAADTSDVLTVRAAQLLYNGVNVVEQGSNTSGQWIKYYDGTMICLGRYTFGSSSYTTLTANSCYTSVDSVKAITFPQAFVSTPFVETNIGATAYLISQASGVTTTAFSLRTYSNYSTTANSCVATYIAIGKWK